MRSTPHSGADALAVAALGAASAHAAGRCGVGIMVTHNQTFSKNQSCGGHDGHAA